MKTALTNGMGMLIYLEARLQSDSGNINYAGFKADASSNAYVDFITKRGSLEAAAQAMAGDIRTAIQTQTLTVSEKAQLMNVLTEIVGDADLAAEFVEGAVDGAVESGYNQIEDTGNIDNVNLVGVGNTTSETGLVENETIDYIKLSEDLGKSLAAEEYNIIDVETADQANADWADMGFDKPPIASGTHVFNVEAGSNSYSRVYCEGYNNPKSRFILRTEDIKGLTAKEIYEKYALPRVPNKIVHLEIPKNILLEVSIVGSQEFNGLKTYGGDIQYAIKDTELLDEWFSNIEDLK